MQGLGYKERLAYLEGAYSLEEAVRILKRDTRHFAKRQLTWFRARFEAVFLPPDNVTATLEEARRQWTVLTGGRTPCPRA